MPIINHISVANGAKKPGDIVWAFAYNANDRLPGQLLRQKPVQGQLLAKKYEVDTINENDRVRYFVPFGKFGTPMWSKVVRVEARTYADTEQDAIEGYNAAIYEAINANLEANKRLQADLLPTKPEPADL